MSALDSGVLVSCKSGSRPPLARPHAADSPERGMISLTASRSPRLTLQPSR